MSTEPQDMDQELEREIADALDSMSTDELRMLTADGADDGANAPDEAGRISGTILSIRGSDVFVDIGGKSEGFLSLSEFEPDAAPEVGQTLSFVHHGVDRESGLTRLSLKEALLDASWESLAVGEVVEARVAGVNKGGLELTVSGMRAFMPAGQVDVVRIDDFSTLIGKTLTCEVTEIDRAARNLLLSRRNVLEREREAAREQLRYILAEGQVRSGVVRKLMDFGAFVDLGGMDGLLHVSDMSYARVKHPSELLSVGDQVEVEVLKIDLVKDRISLGLKQLQTDPWTMVAAKHNVGDVIDGRVIKLMDFGAFVQIEPGVDGLIPISEMSYTKRIAHPREVVGEGDAVQAEIIDIDPEKRRIALSLKRLGEDPWTNVEQRYKVDDDVSGLVTRTTDFGAFIQLEEGLEGLVHISELSRKHVHTVAEVVKAGQVVRARVLNVDPEKRRISLSLKAVAAEPSEDAAAPADPGGDAASPSVAEAPKPARKRKRPLRGGLD